MVRVFLDEGGIEAVDSKLLPDFTEEKRCMEMAAVGVAEGRQGAYERREVVKSFVIGVCGEAFLPGHADHECSLVPKDTVNFTEKRHWLGKMFENVVQKGAVEATRGKR